MKTTVFRTLVILLLGLMVELVNAIFTVCLLHGQRLAAPAGCFVMPLLTYFYASVFRDEGSAWKRLAYTVALGAGYASGCAVCQWIMAEGWL